MENGNINDLFFDEDKIDFIVPDSVMFDRYLKENPDIGSTEMLSGHYRIGFINSSLIHGLIDELGLNFINLPVVLGLLDTEKSDYTGISYSRETNGFGLRGKDILIGIIDTGIDYTKDVFRNADGTTKIAAIYDQNVNGTEPYSLPGTEYTRQMINEALQSDDSFRIVPQKDEVGHGTFLASVAAGREVDDFQGVAPDAELVVVKLKKARQYYLDKYLVPPEQDNVYESTSVILGIEYILEKANELGKPVSILIGVGTNLSSHNGLSIFEEYINYVSKIPGVCITIGGGNEVNAEKHFLGYIINEKEVLDININVQKPNSNVYLSIYNNAPDRISVSVTSPLGEVIDMIPARPRSVFAVGLKNENTYVTVEYDFPTRGSGAQNTVIKLVNARTGIWNIRAYGDIIIDGSIHAWLPMTGLGAEGTVFTKPNPNYTIVVPATALSLICVAAYNSINNTLYNQSSWGPSRFPVMLPDLAAPGVNVPGVFPDGYGVMSGTATTAAHVAGIGALMLECGVVKNFDPAISTSQIRAYLIRGCLRSPDLTYPNTQWGYGRVNLLNTFKMMQNE